MGRGALAVGRTLKKAIPGGEPLRTPKEEPPEGSVELSKPSDFLSKTDRALLGIMEAPSQVGRGLSEVGYRTAIGSTELVGADKAAANLRAGRELSRETYGEPETGIGLAANVATQLVGEGATFMVPGVAASRVGRFLPAASKASRFARLLAAPEGVAQRAVQTFLTGAPIDVALSQAGPEESMAGALGELTGDTELQEVAKDPVSRAAFDVLAGFGLGEVLGEGLEAVGRARARPRAERLGRELADVEARGGDTTALQEAVAKLPPELREAAETSARTAREQLVIEPEGPKGLRRRIAEIADPSVKRELDTAYTDPISGLKNQAAFQRAKARLDADPETELLILDLSNFKAVNDNLGLEAGDQVLQEMGQIIRGTGLDERRLFRAGGDEFIIAAPKG